MSQASFHHIAMGDRCKNCVENMFENIFILKHISEQVEQYGHYVGGHYPAGIEHCFPEHFEQYTMLMFAWFSSLEQLTHFGLVRVNAILL